MVFDCNSPINAIKSPGIKMKKKRIISMLFEKKCETEVGDERATREFSFELT